MNSTTGKVAAVYPNILPQPAAGVSYDIIYRDSAGLEQVVLNVKPYGNRPGVDIKPAVVGSPVFIWWDDDKPEHMRFQLIEVVYHEPCIG